MPKSRKSPKSPDKSHHLLAIAAARLRSQDHTQKQIADHLDVGQPDVSRLLLYAVQEGFLARAPRFIPDRLDQKDIDAVDRLYFLDEQIRKKLDAFVPSHVRLNVRVLPEGEEPFATAAASHVMELLRQSRAVGIMWGRTLQRLASHMHTSEKPPNAAEIQCIPLCGDPVHLMNLRHMEFSASHLAAEIGTALDPGRTSNQPCLVGVPAYLPRRLFIRKDNLGAIWESFICEIPGYQAIFGTGAGKQKPLADSLDTIISGMGIIVPQKERANPEPPAPGAFHEETGDFIRERVAQEENLTEASMNRFIYGDVGGWLLEREGLTAGDRRLVDELNQGWTGLKGEQMAAVARKAKASRAPGVIILAAGPAKAAMVKEIVRRGLVNELLIDATLAAALKKALE
jgi:DNA-binding transcriptional regulator LsrR (DeoR family)